VVSEETGSLAETQEALGHKNLATTRAYVQRIAVRRDKHSRKIVERFGPLTGGNNISAYCPIYSS
jgi:integrase